MKTRDVVLISLLSVGAAAAVFAVAAYLYIRRRRRKREDDEDGTSCAIRRGLCPAVDESRLNMIMMMKRPTTGHGLPHCLKSDHISS
ncbi:unnamed protein product, partial [Brenthis ino]